MVERDIEAYLREQVKALGERRTNLFPPETTGYQIDWCAFLAEELLL